MVISLEAASDQGHEAVPSRRWELYILVPVLMVCVLFGVLLVTGHLSQLLGPLERDGWHYYGERPQILVYHTHGREAYLPAMGRGQDVSAEAAFSRNPEYGVLSVGDHLAAYLHETHGFDVLHIVEFYDERQSDGEMVRQGSYQRSMTGIRPALTYHRDIRVVIDLHRDSPRRNATTTIIDDKAVARLLLVVGRQQTQQSSRTRDQLGLTQQLIQRVKEQHPDLHRGDEPYRLGQRLNQHISPAAFLVEVGGVDNTLEEAERGAEYFADALNRLLEEGDMISHQVTENPVR